jgi:hypothetical protein
MKKSSLLSGLFAGIFGFLAMNMAHAMPTVGDEVIFSSVRVNTGAVTTGTFEMKLASFNTASGNWSEIQTTTENGVAKTETEQVPNSALLTDSSVALLLTSCAGMGTLWIAKGVVFGIVQEDFTQADGTHTVLQLVSQTAGITAR